MATLLACPNETLVNIFSCLNTKDLLSVSRVSRRFYSFSLPFIYKAPILRSLGWHRSSSLPCFIQTLLAQPSLANHVKSLEVELESWCSTPSSPADIQSLALVASLLQYDARKQGMHVVRLLHILPRLAQLSFWPPEGQCFGSRMTHLHAALNNHTMLPVGLRNLREFRSVSNFGFTGELLIAVMALPSIRTIAVTVRTNHPDHHEDELARTRSIIETANAAAGSSTLTELQLLSSDLSARLLAPLLAIPRALTRFRHVSISQQSDFHLDEFGEVLVSLAASLVYLSVGFGRTVTIYEDEPYGWPGTIGALGHWNALEILECPIMALLGRMPLNEQSLVGVLPRSLKCLHVTEDIYWSTEQSVELLVGLLETGEMKSLGEIRFIFVEDVTIPESKLERLRAACEEAHVVFLTQREVIDGSGFQSL